MRSLFITIIFAGCTLAYKAQVCNPLFSFAATFERVKFYNQSIISNAHYYWNFGDGTSSHLKNPIHTYPGNGNFLVTLYVQDTISKCSGFYEVWVPVAKNYNNPCVPDISDSMYVVDGMDKVKIIDNSIGCDGTYSKFYSFAGSCCNQYYFTSSYPANFVSYVGYQKPLDTWFYGVKTLRHNFNPSKNYTPCSANFEFSVASEQCGSGQRILFKAMNKNAASYKWYFTGFGDPIISTSDTVSISYQGLSCTGVYDILSPVYLHIKETNGCKDSMIQSIAIMPSSLTVVGITSNELDETNLQVFPNPVTNKFTIAYSGSLKLSGTLSNVLGQELKQIENISENQAIDLSHLQQGAYFLTLQSETSRRTFKLLKE